MSFLDTLTSISSYAVQGTGNAGSSAQGQSEEGSNDSTNSEGQAQNRSSIQYMENASAASAVLQGKTGSTSVQQADWTSVQSDDKTTPGTKAGSAGDLNAQKASSKKTAFTAQVASQFNSQSSTAQPHLSEMFCASTTAPETLSSKPEVAERSDVAQSGISGSVQPQSSETISASTATSKTASTNPEVTEQPVSAQSGIAGSVQPQSSETISASTATPETVSSRQEAAEQPVGAQSGISGSVQPQISEMLRTSSTTTVATSSNPEVTKQPVGAQSGVSGSVQPQSGATILASTTTSTTLSTKQEGPEQPVGAQSGVSGSVQPQSSETISASTTTSKTVSTNPEVTEQPVSAQSGISSSVQGADLQPQGNQRGSFDAKVALNPQVDRSNSGAQKATTVKTALFDTGQVVLPLPFAGSISQLQYSGNGSAQPSSTSTDANGGSTSNPVSTVRASLSAIVQSDGGINQLAGKVTPAKVLSSGFSSNSDAGDSTDKNKPSKSGDASDLSSSSHSVATAGPQTQHAQTDGAQTAVFEVKGAGTNIPQVSQVAVNAAQTETSVATGTHTSGGSTGTDAHHGDGAESSASQQWVDNGSAGMSGISTARLIQTMGESQMRVGMHSNEFGDISIRTVVSQQQMQTQISVDHSELGSALSAHIPSIQTKLGSEYGLHATIEVNQSGASFSSEGDRSSQYRQQAAVRPVEGAETPVALQNDVLSPRIPAAMGSEYRLDIRA